VEEQDRAEHFKQLKWSLQSLAMSASEQLTLFPDAVRKASELASDFDRVALVTRTEYQGELSAAQADSLAAIVAKLATMSRDAADFEADVWTDAALTSSAHWDEVRTLAKSALAAFGWAGESV